VHICKKKQRSVVTCDIGAAYLNAEMQSSSVLMRLDPMVAMILRLLDKKYKPYAGEDGSMVVRLDKALYGCIESAKLWYENLSSYLMTVGYVQNPVGMCVFNREANGVQCTVSIHVDDLFITCVDEDVIEELLADLTDKYKDLSINRGKVHSYLGMTFDFSVAGRVSITMLGYIKEFLAICGVIGTARTPATENLFSIGDSPLLSDEMKAEFRSLVAKALYLATRVRPELLPLATFLAGRVQSPTEEDWGKLDHGCRYLNGSPELGLVLECDGDINIIGYVDASYGVHPDGKSHTGMAIRLGRGTILAKSSKQKLVSKSSTESELIALSDSSSLIIRCRDFLVAQGYNLKAATIYQDNMSTMALVEKGRSTSDRTKHINVRYFFVKDRVEAGEIKIEHMPTENMIADVLTKPLQGNLFRRLRKELLCCVTVVARRVNPLN